MVGGRKFFGKKRVAQDTAKQRSRKARQARVISDVEQLLPFSNSALRPVNGLLHSFWILGVRDSIVIDPSAGSPTETLLRLLLPLSDKVH